VSVAITRGEHDFYVPCSKLANGRVLLCPVGGAPPVGAVNKGDRCVVLEVSPAGGGFYTALVRNLTRAGEAR